MSEQTTKNEPRIEPAASGPLEKVALAENPADSRPTATPSVSGVSFSTVLLVSAIVSAFSGYMAWRFASDARGADQPSRVVTINTDKIIAEETKAAVSTPGITPVQAAKAADDFGKKLNAVLATYTDAGDIVVNANVVLNPSAATDITPQVMQKLGIQP